MKYSQLVQFEPIESVIELEKSDSPDALRQLAQTFVISDHMAGQLNDLLIPHLQFDKPADNKGLLVVGNYGTGKSHLLSLISGMAESPDLIKYVRSKAVADEAKAIAGKFRVIRLEIPASKNSLRQIICGRFEDFLASEGLSFSFPPDEKVKSNKDDLSRMMTLFNEKYPDQGLLLIVDELLDYLRSRPDQEKIFDLNYLREVGETCKNERLRFIAGLQESLFGNPKFQFVAESIRRVRARFEQVRIARQDVAYVVSERLLKKDDRQKAMIREHLQKFTPLYGKMAERLEDFVQLFPVHPTYLDVFESVSVAEKREVLKTLSAEMRKRLDQDVPRDEPGLICYDTCWGVLRDDASLRSVPEIKEVIDKSKVVEDRIRQAYTRKNLLPMALRVVQGLSVHRLTTDDIYAKIGPTSEELRDGLCLYTMMPERTSDFLKTTVETCLREINRTMSGQFITHNTDNDQYYLDLKKDIDYDAKIQDKADTLSKSEIDQYYFAALTRVLERTDQTYVRGYQIWEHEIEWRDHKVTRLGYLFFGAPNERSTAQPPRDYYIYFIQPFEPPQYEDHKLPDEVYFRLTSTDQNFLDNLKKYAGAKEMAASASSGTKKAYEDKAEGFLKGIVNWLRQNMLTSYEVVHQGVPKKMVEWLKGHRTGNAAVLELVEWTGSTALASSFEDRYPEYPTFSVKLTVSNLKQPIEDVIRWLSGGAKNQQATAILDGLELLDGEKLRPQNSRYARAVLAKLEEKPLGQVLNRKELISVKNDVEVESKYRLEPELLLVVLLSLVQSGDITLSLAGKKLDAGNLGEAARLPFDQLLQFKHIERPKGLPLAEWVAVFDLLGLPEGLIRNPDTHEDAVKQLQSRARELTEKVVTVAQYVQNGLPCWGGELIPTDLRDAQRQKLDDLKGFLEGLQAFNTPGKLKNLTKGRSEIEAQRENLDLVRQVEQLNEFVQELRPQTDYLTTAYAVLPPGDPWRTQMDATRAEWRGKLLEPTSRNVPDFRQKIKQALQKAKDDYKTTYDGLHRKARLGIAEDSRKKDLLKDSRLEKLRKLSQGISLLPHATLTELQNRLANLKPCYSLVKDDLDSNPFCPHCSFRPHEEGLGVTASVALQYINDQLDSLLDHWRRSLLDNLTDPIAEESIGLLPPRQGAAVRSFLKTKDFPDKIDNDLVQGIEAALSGLTAIRVKVSDLLADLGDGNVPCTVEEFKSRVEGFLQRLTKGKELAKVRLVIDKGEGIGG